MLTTWGFIKFTLNVDLVILVYKPYHVCLHFMSMQVMASHVYKKVFDVQFVNKLKFCGNLQGSNKPYMNDMYYKYNQIKNTNIFLICNPKVLQIMRFYISWQTNVEKVYKILNESLQIKMWKRCETLCKCSTFMSLTNYIIKTSQFKSKWFPLVYQQLCLNDHIFASTYHTICTFCK